MQNQRVFIIDDDPKFLDALSAALSSAGFEVNTASDAKTAQPILSRPDPRIDVLIVDLVLPGDLSGFDVISGVTRVRPSFKILTTSAVFRGDQLKYISERMGADEFIQKPLPGEPLNAAQWISTLRRLLNREAIPPK